MKRVLTAVLLTVLVFALLPFARADFGDYSGDSDYGDWGGSDSYSSYDSYGNDDSSSSWSWSSSDDDDYSYRSSYESSDDDSELAADDVPYLLLGILMFIVFPILLFKKIIPFLLDKLFGGSGKGGKRSAVQGGEEAAVTHPISRYSALDPNFNRQAMEAHLSNLYIQMQQCWEKKDISSLRPYLSGMFYEQADRQLESLRKLHNTNYILNPTVLSVKLKGFRQENGMDVMVAELRCRLIDYTLSDSTGRLIKGSKTAEKFMRYDWELVRPIGMQTSAPGELTTVTCPHCGAPVNINQSAQCEYCGSVLTVAEHDFVLNKIITVAQKTK